MEKQTIIIKNLHSMKYEHNGKRRWMYRKRLFKMFCFGKKLS